MDMTPALPALSPSRLASTRSDVVERKKGVKRSGENFFLERIRGLPPRAADELAPWEQTRSMGIAATGQPPQLITAGPGIVGMKLTGVVNNSGARRLRSERGIGPCAGPPAGGVALFSSSRHCETDLLSEFAWGAFGSITGGYARVQTDACSFALASTSATSC
jgi:hypothetical protein